MELYHHAFYLKYNHIEYGFVLNSKRKLGNSSDTAAILYDHPYLIGVDKYYNTSDYNTQKNIQNLIRKVSKYLVTI